MSSELGMAASVGFRHVVEDGLALLRDRRLPKARRAYVLEELAKLLSEAARGRDIMAEQTLFVGARDRNAYESYSLLDRYLRDEDWKGRLDASQEALRQLAKGALAPEHERFAATSLLEELLASLEEDASSGLPLIPEDLDFSRQS